MAAAEILAATGGLPPTAFDISRQEPSLTNSVHRRINPFLPATPQESAFSSGSFWHREHLNLLETCVRCGSTSSCSCAVWADLVASLSSDPENNQAWEQHQTSHQPPLATRSWHDHVTGTQVPALDNDFTASSAHVENSTQVSSHGYSPDYALAFGKFHSPVQVDHKVLFKNNFNEPTRADGAAPAVMKARRGRATLPNNAKKILKESFNIEPYPDSLEVSSIAKASQMTIKQVKTWFTNKRNRTPPSRRGTFP